MSEREITIKVDDYRVDDAYGGGKKFIITAQVAQSLMENITPTILNHMIEQIGKQLTDAWMIAHGQAVFEQLAPGAIADAIKQKVTEQVYKTMGIEK